MISVIFFFLDLLWFSLGVCVFVIWCFLKFFNYLFRALGLFLRALIRSWNSSQMDRVFSQLSLLSMNIGSRALLYDVHSQVIWFHQMCTCCVVVFANHNTECSNSGKFNLNLANKKFRLEM